MEGRPYGGGLTWHRRSLRISVVEVNRPDRQTRAVRRESDRGLLRAVCGVNPIPASSGWTRRHRLDRAGDRGASRTLHMIAVLRMRWHEPIRSYVRRRTGEGVSTREIIRCLKRVIAREAYHATRADLPPGTP